MSMITTVILVQQYMTRYVLSTILAFGILGNLLSIGFVFEKHHRKNCCSIYLVALSVFGLIASCWAIVPLVYALDHFDIVDSSLIFFCTRGYIIQVTSMCFRSTLVLVCLDRYALCNSHARIRALCRPQIAYRSIGILIIFWTIASIHLVIFETIENNRCYLYGLYGQIYSFSYLIFAGILPISCMIFIGIILIKNLRQIRSRVQPLQNVTRLNQRDIKLMKVVLIEVIVYVLCTFTNTITLIYTTTTNNMISNENAQRKQIESFFSFITLSVLLYLNYNTPFYVHIFASHAYRKGAKQSIMKLIEKCRKIKPNEIIAQRTTNPIKAGQ